jgi:protein SCO1/2/putative membrane protein
MNLAAFPAVNASLNAAAGVLIVCGYISIRRRAVVAHVSCMIGAVLCSAAFLACYLTYHTIKSMHGQTITRFPEHSTWKPLYLVILTSHTILAAVVLPMIVVTVVRASRRRWAAHKKIARKTFWFWIYV